MKKIIYLRDLEKKAIDLYGKYKLVIPENKEESFSIFNVDTFLLHPKIKDPKLLREEFYRLSTGSELSRGQYNFEIQCISKEELLEIFLYLTRKGYKYTKILWQSTREIKRVWYTFEELEKYKKGYAPGIHNILEVIINLKDLERFKKDVRDLTKLGYKNVWRGRVYDFWNKDRIID